MGWDRVGWKEWKGYASGMGWEDKGCRHGMGKAAEMGMGSGMPQGVWDLVPNTHPVIVLNTQAQKLKICPTAFLFQSRGSISSAMGASNGSLGELRACLAAQRARDKAAELDPRVWGP